MGAHIGLPIGGDALMDSVFQMNIANWVVKDK
jgi:hypothetical protein